MKTNDKKVEKAKTTTKKETEKSNSKKRKFFNLKTIFFVAFSIFLVLTVYNLYVFFTTGEITTKIYLVNKYYAGSEFAASIDVTDNKTNMPVEATVEATLYDSNGRKVKNGETKVKSESYSDLNITIPLADELEEGNYEVIFKVKTDSGNAKIEKNVYITNKSKENINIAFDKGIYKPGDEVNFRTLILSANDDTPQAREAEISIYDGNENRVYVEKIKTSEFGIASTKFKLADEVNSGTYTVKITTEKQEYSQNFKVDAYITPQFSVEINSNTDEVKVKERIDFEISTQYFFGEPVKDAELKITMDGKEAVVKTNSEGKANYGIEFQEEGSYEMVVKATDSSNYYAEASKKIYVYDDTFKIEVIPEYGSLVKKVDNKIYIYTKTIKDEPLECFADIEINNINKTITTDKNGIGYIYLNAQEIENCKGIINVTAKRKDNGEVETVMKNIGIDEQYNVISTDKVKYENSDDIEVTVKNARTDNKSIAFVKNGELLKIVNTTEENVTVNLDGEYGLIDIYCESTLKANSTVTYKNATANRKTIFIKPNKELNINIQTDKEEYKPGEEVELTFSAKDIQETGVDTALLVSILDEANLNVVENDLSIDNIKLALEGIKFTDELDAASLYACILDENAEEVLTGLLIKQDLEDFGGKTYTNSSAITKRNAEENVKMYGVVVVLLGILYFANVIIKKIPQKHKSNILVEIVDFICTWILMSFVLGDVIYDIVGEDIIVFISTAIMTVIVSLLVFREIKNQVCAFYLDMLFGIISMITLIMLYEMSTSLAFIFVLIVILIYAILKQSKLTGKYEGIRIIIEKVIKNSIIIFLSVWIADVINNEYLILPFAILIYLLLKLYDKLKITERIKIELARSASAEHGRDSKGNLNDYAQNLKNAQKNNSEKKEIVTNINFSQISGVVILLIFIFAILLLRENNSAYYDTTTNMGPVLPGAIMESDTTSSADTKGNDSGFTLDSLKENMDQFVQSSEDASKESTIIENTETENVYTEEIIEETESKVRNVFLESLAFIPELVIEKGEGNLKVKTSDNITTWSVQVVGNTKNGDVGYTNTSFRVFKEFFVDFTLPMNAKVGDKVSIPITVYNYTDKNLNVNYKVEKQEWFETTDSLDGNVNVDAKGTKLVYFTIEITKDGYNKFRVETNTESYSDIVEKSMDITIKGVEISEIVSNGFISDKTDQEAIFMEDYIEGSNKITVKLYPNMMALNVEGIESIFKLPTGCFEQVSSSLYPNILALKYLNSKDDIDEELRNKVLNYLNVGYQKLLTYEVKTDKGGFSLYGNSPAETLLTAYGLMEFYELKEVYDIDSELIKRIEKFLEDRQNLNGSFKLVGSNTAGIGSRSDEYSLQAYIIWAISQSNVDKEVLNKAITYLENNIDHFTDPYALGLVANAFVNVENDKADAIIERLVANLENDNNTRYLKSNICDYWGTRGNYQNIQATSLLSIALSKTGKNQDINQKLIEYILDSKRANGTWGTTQATILALKAINTYEEKNSVSNQKIEISVGDEKREIDIKEDACDYYVETFENVSKENRVKINGAKGNVYYEIIGSYFVEYDKVETSDSFEISVEMQKELTVNQDVNQKIVVKNNSDDIVENAMVVVSIPQGFTVNTSSLEVMKGKGIIEKFENNYGKINIYLRDFEKNQTVELNINYRTMYPIECLGGEVRIFDYYNPDIETIYKPMEFKVK